MMRAPRQYVYRKNNQIQAYQVWIERSLTVAEEEDNHLRDAKSRNAEQRPKRTPLRPKNEQNDKA